MTPDPGAAPIEREDSIARTLGQETGPVLRTVAERYVGDAPRQPFTFRATPAAASMMDGAGRTSIDFAERFPNANGDVAYAWGQIPPTCEWLPTFAVEPHGPMRIFLDGECIAEGDTRHQSGRDGPLEVEFPVTASDNDVLIECERTPAGFGCTLEPQFSWEPLRVVAPTTERNGQAGWVYTAPLSEPLDGYPREARPDRDESVDIEEAATGVEWLPEPPDSDNRRGFAPFVDADASQAGERALAWTSLSRREPDPVTLTLEHDHRLQVFCDGTSLYDEGAGPGSVEIEAGLDAVDLLVGYDVGESKDSLDIGIDGPAAFEQPHPVAGTDEAWFHAGPLEIVRPENATLEGLVGADQESPDTRTYWRTAPSTWVRPYAEREPFGTWAYPVGVTLYGLLETGRFLERADLVEYVTAHLRQCTTFFEYLEWDRERFGLPAVNSELAACSMLDHCGSMAATLLEAREDAADLPGADAVADYVAEYMSERQERLPDGTFYRRPSDIPNMNETLWADDLYMSTPFLARYADDSGDDAYLEDAIHQFERFEHYLGMEDRDLLSHVYDGRHEAATGVPWGRGNGWALFSMAETLDRTPEDHPDRSALLDRFQRFAAGYLDVQAADGFWHQVLTDPDSYKETSCTAMFTWAFARGVRRGWLPADPYASAARDGWRALAHGAIDADGNVHGVAHGSSYSFDADYYTEDLGTITNDRHGIGIVLLAGVETQRLLEE